MEVPQEFQEEHDNAPNVDKAPQLHCEEIGPGILAIVSDKPIPSIPYDRAKDE